MSDKSSDKATRLLEGAYAIRTVSDSIEYYRDFAEIYDTDFADRMGYVYPAMLASVFVKYRRDSDAPIADIGCGTGLVAESIRAIDSNPPGIEVSIDGIDISQEMIDTARIKNLYRDLHQADLTQDMDQLPGNYGAIVSAGTFTFGHLGPCILSELLKLGRTDTLYCIGVNSVHLREHEFAEALNTMVEQQLICQPTMEVRKIFDAAQATDASHAEDTATILVYRQL